jgi:hypothetical protein
MILRYVGEGDFLIGVPARDLTADEAVEYGGVERLVASGLYSVDDHADQDPIEPIEEVLLSQVINLADGVDETEASFAGKTLQKRRTK